MSGSESDNGQEGKASPTTTTGSDTVTPMTNNRKSNRKRKSAVAQVRN